MRNKVHSNPASIQKATNQKKEGDKQAQGMAKALSSFIDPALSWADIAWFRSITKMPIVLKGIQTAEDALLAVHHGVEGIVVSNHGGRQLDFARSGIDMLQEVMEALKEHQVEDRLEVCNYSFLNNIIILTFHLLGIRGWWHSQRHRYLQGPGARRQGCWGGPPYPVCNVLFWTGRCGEGTPATT